MNFRIFTRMLSLLVLGPILSNAQDFWQQTDGPEGGSIRSIVMNSNDQIFSGAYGGGVFRSDDDGETWVEMNDGLSNKNVQTLKVKPNGHLFVGTYQGGMFRSTDDGVSWTQVNSGLTSTSVTDITISPSGDLFAGTFAGVFRSSDNGETWTQVSTGLTSTTHSNMVLMVNALTIDGSGSLFAGTWEGVFRSSDNGESWTQMNSGIANQKVVALAVDGANRIFAGTTGGGNVYRSDYFSESWVEIHHGLTDLIAANCFAFNDDEIFIGTARGGIVRSTDDGDSWTEMNTGLTNPWVYSFLYKSDGDLFAGTLGGVYRFMENSDSWIQKNKDLTGSVVNTFTNHTNGDVFAGTFGSGFFRSEDGGVTWGPVHSDLTGLTVQASTINPSGNLFFGARYNGMFRSTDDGESWSMINNGLPRLHVQSLSVLPNGYLIAGIYQNGIYRSTDDGDSWSPANSGITETDILVLICTTNGHVFAGTGSVGVVYRSTDHGDSWEQIHSSMNVQSFATSDGDILAGTTSQGVFLSTDNGVSWHEKNVGLSTLDVPSLTVSSTGQFFAGTHGGGVFQSMDDGESWTQINDGLTNQVVTALTEDSEGYILAGTEGSGVFRSDRLTTAKPDLIIGSQILSDSVGPEIVFSMQMRNQGDADAVGPFHVHAYLSLDQQMSVDSDYLIQDYFFNGTLQPDSDIWTPTDPGVTLPDVPPGKYYLWGYIDAEGHVDELNEGNNFKLLDNRRVTVLDDTGVEPGWLVQDSGTDNILYDVDAVSRSVGWVVGRESVLRTTNRGKQWENVTSGGDSLWYYVIEALDADIALVGATSINRAYLLKTIDGGQHWTVVHTIKDGFVDDITMFSGSHGIAIGDDGQSYKILETQDGGDTWSEKTSFLLGEAGEHGSRNAVQWRGNTECWLGTNRPKVYHSTDGGSEWTEVPVTDVSSVWTLMFDDGGTGFAAGGNQIAKTTDHGATWSGVEAPAAGNMSESKFFNGRHWLCAGNELYVSSDEGDSWTLEVTGSSIINGMSLVLEDGYASGWVVGSYGMILRYLPVETAVPEDATVIIPERLTLHQNYPNPFNPETQIEYDCPASCVVEATVYDVRGNKVRVLERGLKNAGTHRLSWNGQDAQGESVPSGLYLLQVKAGEVSRTVRMLLLR